MGALEFINLQMDDRVRVTKTRGNIISYRATAWDQVLLYHIDHFFVELYYELSTGNLRQLITYTSLDQLEAYLDHIEIDVNDLLVGNSGMQ